MKNFAVIGVAGFVAPRHLQAIRDTGNRLIAATDPNDSVGLLDRYSFDVKFFREIERFDRFLEKLRRGPEEQRVHWVSICSPNYLHDAHVRLALRVGADAICEKPLVINPWNLDALEDLERETGRRVFTVLQLRLNPALIALREELLAKNARHAVRLRYITARGAWYHTSWKGSTERSGGLATNIGIHLFDLLIWLFGAPSQLHVARRDDRGVAGTLVLERADVEWFLSVDIADVPAHVRDAGKTTHRSMEIDGTPIDFTEAFTELHTRLYERTLAGDGFRIADARPSIELVHRIRTARIEGAS